MIWHNSVEMRECSLCPCHIAYDMHSAMAEKLHRGSEQRVGHHLCPWLHAGVTEVVHCCRCLCRQLALWSSSTAPSQSLVEWPALFLVSIGMPSNKQHGSVMQRRVDEYFSPCAMCSMLGCTQNQQQGIRAFEQTVLAAADLHGIVWNISPFWSCLSSTTDIIGQFSAAAAAAAHTI